MNAANTGSVGGDKQLDKRLDKQLEDYRGLEGRIIRLEEHRKAHDREHLAHEKEHDEHVATKKWVYQKGWAVAALVAVVASSIAVGLLRALL